MAAPMCSEAWRAKVEEDHAIADAAFASGRGVCIDDYRTAALVRVRELLNGLELRMRMHQGALGKWLEEGEFKTMLQGGESTGSRNRDDRLRVELELFGISLDAGSSVRPRYGYLQGSTEDHRELNKHGLVVVRLDSALVPDTTVVFGDSMGSTHIGGWASTGPEPLAEPALLCRYSKNDVCAAGSLAGACDQRFEFAEGQIFASLSTNHIVELVFCGGEVPADDLRRRIRDLDLRLRELAGFLD